MIGFTDRNMSGIGSNAFHTILHHKLPEVAFEIHVLSAIIDRVHVRDVVCDGPMSKGGNIQHPGQKRDVCFADNQVANAHGFLVLNRGHPAKGRHRILPRQPRGSI